MSKLGETILKEALTLGENERRDIAERLLETLESSDDFIDDDKWESELNRRAEEMDKDPGGGIAWEELRNKWKQCHKPSLDFIAWPRRNYGTSATGMTCGVPSLRPVSESISMLLSIDCR